MAELLGEGLDSQQEVVDSQQEVELDSQQGIQQGVGLSSRLGVELQVDLADRWAEDIVQVEGLGVEDTQQGVELEPLVAVAVVQEGVPAEVGS